MGFEKLEPQRFDLDDVRGEVVEYIDDIVVTRIDELQYKVNTLYDNHIELQNSIVDIINHLNKNKSIKEVK